MISIVPMWARLLAAIAVITAVIGGAAAIHHRIYQKGWDARDTLAKLDNARIEREARNRLATAADQALTKERELNRALSDESTRRLIQEKDHEKTIADLRAAARAGAIKLSIATAGCPVLGASTGADTSAAGGLGGEARSELMPTAAEDILSIAGDIAKDVRERNALIDRYNTMREACNAP